jgi:hypothetical protein
MLHPLMPDDLPIINTDSTYSPAALLSTNGGD